jgi:hypothetical protein
LENRCRGVPPVGLCFPRRGPPVGASAPPGAVLCWPRQRSPRVCRALKPSPTDPRCPTPTVRLARSPRQPRSEAAASPSFRPGQSEATARLHGPDAAVALAAARVSRCAAVPSRRAGHRSPALLLLRRSPQHRITGRLTAAPLLLRPVSSPCRLYFSSCAMSSTVRGGESTSRHRCRGLRCCSAPPRRWPWSSRWALRPPRASGGRGPARARGRDSRGPCLALCKQAAPHRTARSWTACLSGPGRANTVRAGCEPGCRWKLAH